MKRLFGVIWIAVSLVCLTACGKASTVGSANSADSSKAESATPPAPAPKITLPAGTRMRVILKEGIGTDVSSPGAEFPANLSAPIVIDGKTVLPKGAPAVVRVVDVRKPGRVKGRASLSLVLASVVHNGRPVPLETRTYVGVAKSTKKRDAGIIAGAAGVGAAIGAIAGGGKGTATGAAVGGAGGTGAVLATRGNDLHYPPETGLSFVLAKPAEM